MSDVAVKELPASTPIGSRLIFLGLAQLLLVVGLLVVYDWREHILIFLSLSLLSFLPFGLALLTVLQDEKRGGKRRLLFIVALSVVMRVVLLPTPPRLSDDIYRYVWEGRVQLAGLNPYALSPDSPELLFLRDEIYEGVNNKPISTIYPPIAQFIFLGVSFCGGELLATKALMIVFDCLLILVLIGLLRKLSLDPCRVILYAWNPLVLVEVAGSGHIDVLAILLLFVGIRFLIPRTRSVPALVSLTLAGLAKVVPFFLLPVLLPRRVRILSLLILPILVVVVYLPYAGAGESLVYGAGQYAERWRHNDFLFSGLVWAFSGFRDGVGDEDSRFLAKAVVGAGLILLSLGVVWRKVDLMRGAGLIACSLIACSPTVHPWYVLWTLPWLVFRVNLAWLYFSMAVLLSYRVWLPDASGEFDWEVPTWIIWLEYGPWLCLLSVPWVLKRGGRSLL